MIYGRWKIINVTESLSVSCENKINGIIINDTGGGSNGGIYSRAWTLFNLTAKLALTRNKQ